MSAKASPLLEFPVCVTGASGFLGSCLVKALLDKGYTVHGTVRSLNDKGKYDYLRNLDGASNRLKLFEADLLKRGSFQEAIEGTKCVFHTASPFFFKGGTKDNLVKPALEGTENVLQSVAKVKSVECVVVTSSTAAVYVNYNTESTDPKKVYTEEDWSDIKSMEDNKAWYPLSKTLAEKRAAELAAKTSYRIVYMNPTLIFGPMLQPNLNTSNAAVLAFIDGTRKEIPNSAKTVVDVRDVADAHIKAYENDQAKGRYLLIAESVTWTTLCEGIKSALTAIDKKDRVASVPTKLSSEILKGGFGAPPPDHTLFDCSKANKDLGVKFRLSKEMILDTIKSLHQQKHFK